MVHWESIRNHNIHLYIFQFSWKIVFLPSPPLLENHFFLSQTLGIFVKVFICRIGENKWFLSIGIVDKKSIKNDVKTLIFQKHYPRIILTNLHHWSNIYPTGRGLCKRRGSYIGSESTKLHSLLYYSNKCAINDNLISRWFMFLKGTL